MNSEKAKDGKFKNIIGKNKNIIIIASTVIVLGAGIIGAYIINVENKPKAIPLKPSINM